MKLRRRLLVTMIGLVAVGLAALNIITLNALHSYLYGRVDDQLTAASHQIVGFVHRADERRYPITPASISTHVGPDVYVEFIDLATHRVISRPSETQGGTDPPPILPTGLHHVALRGTVTKAPPNEVYRPSSNSVTVPALGGHGPEFRLQATTVAGHTLIVATSLTAVNATLDSLRTIQLAVSLGLLAALLLLMTILIRQGLRPLEAMAKEATSSPPAT